MRGSRSDERRFTGAYEGSFCLRAVLGKKLTSTKMGNNSEQYRGHFASLSVSESFLTRISVVKKETIPGLGRNDRKRGSESSTEANHLRKRWLSGSQIKELQPG